MYETTKSINSFSSNDYSDKPWGCLSADNQNMCKNTPIQSILHEAIKNIDECYETVQKIITEGYEVDERSQEGYTPLYMLAGKSSENALKAIKLLVSHGADIHARQDSLPGYITPLQCAKYTDFAMKEETGEKGSPRTKAMLSKPNSNDNQKQNCI
ncbi:MAG: ankyrin repeat domain-containing protein [Chlamydiota bacterium]|nr:ankyrin repeat domain-containing protein [Chlamydiota bacterium]